MAELRYGREPVTWAEVHRVNARVRDALKAKGLLGANDVSVQVLDKLDLTDA